LTGRTGSRIFRNMSNSLESPVVRFAGMFKALSNPNRLNIFLRLVSCCPPGTVCTTDVDMRSCVGELGKDLDIAPSTVSHHIKELHRAGLIHMERNGQNVECWIDLETVRTLGRFLAGPPSS